MSVEINISQERNSRRHVLFSAYLGMGIGNLLYGAASSQSSEIYGALNYFIFGIWLMVDEKIQTERQLENSN